MEKDISVFFHYLHAYCYYFQHVKPWQRPGLNGSKNKCYHSKIWRECIKHIFEIDPLRCPLCGGQLNIISFITNKKVIKKILEHLDLWRDKPSRDPPHVQDAPIIYESLYGDSQSYDDP
ncbi:MAG: hypothetical protein ACMUIP_16415 [bacterium]